MESPLEEAFMTRLPIAPTRRPPTGPAAAGKRLSSRLLLPLAFGLTLFVSAGLLFLVQPMVARMVLPLLGGTPGVWNTCMVFFQALLLAGYAYAHAGPRWLGEGRHALVHAGLVVLALVVLPIGVAGWVPPAEGTPIFWLLGLLLVTVGMPVFVLAASTPLLQRWFARLGHPTRKDPYFLYAASNLGSMLAVLGYPLLVEPGLSLAGQARWWQIGFVLLAALTAGCALLTWGRREQRRSGSATKRAKEENAKPALAWSWGLYWMALALVPSSVMLGVTTHITTDVGSVPLFWVLPLALYLFSLILVFSRVPVWLAALCFWLLPVMVLVLVWLQATAAVLEVRDAVLVHLLALFLVCMVCHGEMARTRPRAEHLTSYYLWIALGGVLGGLLNGLVAPLLLDRVVEYPLVLVAAFFLVPRFRSSNDRTAAFADAVAAGKPPPLALLLPSFGLIAGVLLVYLEFTPAGQQVLYQQRNFFGVIRVRYEQETDTNQLFYGTALHGSQFRDPRRRRDPLVYFSREGPVGQVFQAFSGPRAKQHVALIGLGTGTLASYAEPGQDWTYYEINPAVEEIAWDQRYFTFLSDAVARGAHVTGRLGDGRLQMDRSTDRYDLIVLDAFSSDAVPVHLLTREALEVYLGHLTEDGILAFHVSSRFCRLLPVVAALARDAGLAGLSQDDQHLDPPRRLPSTWVLLARRPEHFGKLHKGDSWQPLSQVPSLSVWTDDHSNLLSVLLWSEGRIYVPELKRKR
jgi:hypothetical protein